MQKENIYTYTHREQAAAAATGEMKIDKMYEKEMKPGRAIRWRWTSGGGQAMSYSNAAAAAAADDASVAAMTSNGDKHG